MALVAGRWFTVIELKETSGKSTRLRFEQSNPADYAAALVAQTAIVTDLAPITKSKIYKVSTYQEYVEGAFTLPSGAENQNTAILNFSIEGNPVKSGSVRVPAAADGVFAAATGPNYDVVDINDADLLAFCDNFLLDALFWLSDGEQADALLSGHRATKYAARS